MKRLQIPQKLVYGKFYVHEKILHEIAAVNLSKIYFLKKAKKSCKPNNRDLNRDWKNVVSYQIKLVVHPQPVGNFQKIYITLSLIFCPSQYFSNKIKIIDF